MIKGGYKIIDFNDAPLTTGGPAKKIDGIYDSLNSSLNGSYRKPLLISGLNIDGIGCNDIYATTLTFSGTNYVFTAYGKTITITDADAVSAVNA